MARLYHNGEYIGEVDPESIFGPDCCDGRMRLEHYRDAWIYERTGPDEILALPRHWQNVLPPITVRSGPMAHFFGAVRKRLGIT